MDKMLKLIKTQILQKLVKADEEYNNFNVMFDDEGRTTEEKIGIFREICENKGKIDALKDLHNFILITEKMCQVIEEKNANNKNI